MQVGVESHTHRCDKNPRYSSHKNLSPCNAITIAEVCLESTSLRENRNIGSMCL